MNPPESRAATEALDRDDPLARYRDRFAIPDKLVYLVGNSLGPPTRTTADRLSTVIEEEWGHDLVRAWNTRDWIDLPARVAARIAPLVGASTDEVVVADSISLNLFKLLAAALELRSGRSVILSEHGNFPTDLYMAQGLADLLGDRALLRLVDRNDVIDALDPSVAVLMLTHVDFRSGEIHDMEAITRVAHQAGVLVLWDLAHSAGAVPVNLGGCEVDLGVGCGYKYLNGGPGAPAFAYVARRHQSDLRPVLAGWMGHRNPFSFDPSYHPAPGISRLLVGTPPILSLVALDEAVQLISEIGIDALRRKSIALTELFIGLVDRELEGHGFEMASPRNADRRGSQVALRHPQGYAIMQALISSRVMGDFRAPDLLRFGFAPAYNRFVDAWDAVATLRRIMADREWDRAEFKQRTRVT